MAQRHTTLAEKIFGKQNAHSIGAVNKRKRKNTKKSSNGEFMSWEEYSTDYWTEEKALDQEWETLEGQVMDLLREYTMEVMLMDEYVAVLAQMDICRNKIKQHKDAYATLQKQYILERDQYYLNQLLATTKSSKKKAPSKKDLEELASLLK